MPKILLVTLNIFWSGEYQQRERWKIVVTREKFCTILIKGTEQNLR